MERIARVATGSSALCLVAAGGRLVLALPAACGAARVVIDLYQPQRWKGKGFKVLAKLIAATGIARRRPGFAGLRGAAPLVTWLRAAAAGGSVGFLGCNPNHGPRCVLAGIDPVDGRRFIAKLGLDGSAAAVRREAAILQALLGKVPGVIEPLGLEQAEPRDRTQSGERSGPGGAAAAGGCPEPDCDFDWALLRLPHLGNEAPKSMAEPGVRRLLDRWLGDGTRLLGESAWAAGLIQQAAVAGVPSGWHERMSGRRVRGALVHGDFAVWNLRMVGNDLVALDWEWGQENAVAGVDLAHGLRQECYMVRRMNPKQAVAWMLEQAASPAWSEYLAAAGWEAAHEDWLRLGLLHSHFHAHNHSAEMLAELGIHLGNPSGRRN